MKKLSIIIPVYNSSKYLSKCLDSFINGLNKETEVLLIDDGSNDNSGEICDAYAKKCANIRTVHKKNGGPSSTRNVGLQKAHGRWITFIDSDDIVVSNYIELISKIIKNTTGDLVFFKLKKIYKNNQKQDKLDFELNKLKTIDKEQALYYLTRQDYGNFPFTKIYKRTLFNNIKFPEQQDIYEDMAILYRIVDASNRIEVYNDYLYFYYLRVKSISHNKAKNPIDYIKGIQTAYSFYKYLITYSPNDYIEKAIKLNNYFLYSQYLDMVYSFRSDNHLVEYKNKVKFVSKMIPSIKREGAKVYFSFLLYKKSPKLFYFIYRLFKSKKIK